MNFVMVWVLRRHRDQLAARVQWLRDMLWTYRAGLIESEKALQAAQARLWAAESARSLLKPSRPVDGNTKTEVA